MIGLGLGVAAGAQSALSVSFDFTITISQEPSIAGVGTVEAGTSHATIVALASAGVANTDGPGGVTITPFIVGASDPVRAGEALILRVQYGATGAAPVIRDLGPIQVPAPTPALFAHNGVSFTLSNVVTQGVHADGSPWVAVDPGAQITQTAPASAALDHDHLDDLGDPVVTNAAAHGLMDRPGRAMAQHQATLASRQQYNDLARGGMNGAQGWTELTLKPSYMPYEPTFNIDPGATGAPVDVTPGVYVKAQSYTDEASLGADGRPTLAAMGVLTVYPTGSTIAPDAFRAPYAGDGTPSPYALSDLDMSGFQSLPITALPSGAPVSFADMDTLLSQVLHFHNTYNTLSEFVMPAERPRLGNTPDFQVSSYLGTTMETVGAAMVLLHTDAWSAVEKRQIAGRLVQIGLDLIERAKQGGIFYANGGHSSGVKILAAFAAQLLGSPAALTEVLSYTDQGTAGYDGSQLGDSIWADDGMFAYISQADVDATVGNTASGRDISYPASMIGWPDWVGEARNNLPGGFGNWMGNSNDAPRQYASQVGAIYNLMCLGARLLPGLKALIDTDVMFDFTDRHMQFYQGDDTMAALTGVRVLNTSNAPKDFGLEAWTAWRGTDGVWGPVLQGLTLTEMPFDGYVFDTQGQASGIAIVRGTGVSGSNLQVRASRTGGDLAWQSVTVAGDGTWQASLPFADEAEMAHWYVPEVRVGTDDGTKITGTNTFSCGTVIAFMGQSQLEYVLEDGTFYSENYTRALDADNLTVLLEEQDSGAVEFFRVRKVVQGGEALANVGCIALANMLNHTHPGRKLMVVDLAEPGTDPRALFNNAETSDRYWETFEAYVNVVREGGSDIGAIFLNWQGSPEETMANMHAEWAPALFGQNADGSTYTFGTVRDDQVFAWDNAVEHCLYDLDAAPGALGRGVVTQDRTKLYLFQAMPFMDSGKSGETTQFDESLRVTNDNRAGVLALAASAQFQTVGALMPSTHLSDFGGGTHPYEVDVMGVPQFAMLHTPGLMAASGLPVAEPLILDAQATDTNVAEITIDLPNGGTLTTLRALLGETLPTTAPHQQEATGFQIQRGAIKRPVYRLTETGYPASHRGTVEIIDAGTGTVPNRTGTVRITLEEPIGAGDALTYLDGQAMAVLLHSRDAPAQLFKDMLLENVPALYDATADHPFYGVPLRPQTAMPALAAPVTTASLFDFSSTPVGSYQSATAIPGGWEVVLSGAMQTVAWPINGQLASGTNYDWTMTVESNKTLSPAVQARGGTNASLSTWLQVTNLETTADTPIVDTVAEVSLGSSLTHIGLRNQSGVYQVVRVTDQSVVTG